MWSSVATWHFLVYSLVYKKITSSDNPTRGCGLHPDDMAGMIWDPAVLLCNSIVAGGIA